jgi:hypothetical protein
MRVYSTTNLAVIGNKFINVQYGYYEQDSATANLLIGNMTNNATTPFTIVGTTVNFFADRALIGLTSQVTGKLPFANLANGTAHSVVGRA